MSEAPRAPDQFAVESGERLYGPFPTPEAAYKYAAERQFLPIHIRELRTP